jgi:uncharacterized integral membrane protein
MRTFKLYFYGLLVLLFAIFILQNYSTLTYSVALRLNLGFLSLVSIPLPLFLVAPLFFFCGLFLATMIGWGERRRLSKELKQLKSVRAESKPESRPETRQENRTGSDSKKKPDEGTIVSSGPLIKKTGAPEEPNPPFRS